jgi:hypothetical protein
LRKVISRATNSTTAQAKLHDNKQLDLARLINEENKRISMRINDIKQSYDPTGRILIQTPPIIPFAPK